MFQIAREQDQLRNMLMTLRWPKDAQVSFESLRKEIFLVSSNLTDFTSKVKQVAAGIAAWQWKLSALGFFIIDRSLIFKVYFNAQCATRDSSD